MHGKIAQKHHLLLSEFTVPLVVDILAGQFQTQQIRAMHCRHFNRDSLRIIVDEIMRIGILVAHFEILQRILICLVHLPHKAAVVALYA